MFWALNAPFPGVISMAAKRSKAKPVYQKTIIPPKGESPATGGWRPSKGLLFRAGLALLVVLLAVGGWQAHMRHVQADSMAQKAWQRAGRPNALIIGTRDIRRALQVAPDNPRIQNQLALLLLQQESQRAVSRGMEAIDFRNVTEALELLRKAEAGHQTPQHLLVKAGETANMMAIYASRVGDTESQREYVEIAVERLNTYRHLHGMAVGTEDTFYEIAVRRSFDDGQPNLALTFRDDYELWFRIRMNRNRTVGLTSVQAYRQMGEFHLMMAELARMILQEPRDMEVLALIEEMALDHGLEKHAVLILEELERRGALDAVGQQLLESLERRLPPPAPPAVGSQDEAVPSLS